MGNSNAVAHGKLQFIPLPQLHVHDRPYQALVIYEVLRAQTVNVTEGTLDAEGST